MDQAFLVPLGGVLVHGLGVVGQRPVFGAVRAFAQDQIAIVAVDVLDPAHRVEGRHGEPLGVLAGGGAHIAAVLFKHIQLFGGRAVIHNLAHVLDAQVRGLEIRVGRHEVIAVGGLLIGRDVILRAVHAAHLDQPLGHLGHNVGMRRKQIVQRHDGAILALGGKVDVVGSEDVDLLAARLRQREAGLVAAAAGRVGMQLDLDVDALGLKQLAQLVGHLLRVFLLAR